jgi:hypothetical protein
VTLRPSITINNITYRGEFDGLDFFKAICAGFLKKPDICSSNKVFSIMQESGIAGIKTNH